MTKQDLVDITSAFFGEKKPSKRDMERYQEACTEIEEYFREKGVNQTPMQSLERMNKVYRKVQNKRG